ncbi:MAG: type I polyketide synthase [Alphaproteobacteria bacterium]
MSALAIIGYACRFPGGADTPDKYWELLAAGRDAVSEIPDERWDKANFQHPDPREPGRAYTFRAGVLDDVAGFDFGFFNISPREAEQMDPQQRLLLELTYEALERGGVVPGNLAGANCSVHVGISSTDYADIRQGDPTTANAYFMTGSTLSVAANRISYLLDLRGPSVAIDTACSSALFALDDAWRSIREGRADMAIVGAVSLLLSPYPFIGFSKATMLSPYGQCRAFDETADGYVRGEGGGVMVVKKLADAERDGDPIFAVLRGIATNNDGRTMGIAQPSAVAQEKLLREVYRAARIKLRDVAYIEAHGTGTSVGDPIEATSVGRAIAKRRPRKMPLYIGSAKTNIGHLEPASGMAGLIKAIEVLRHNTIPPSLHADRLNPEIDFNALNLRVASQTMELPASEGAPIVGVNSFGFGGTNAHAILQAWRPAKSRTPPLPEDVAPLFLSARSEPALRAIAVGVADHMRLHPKTPARDVAATLARHRTEHDHRLVARGMDRDDLLARLDGFAATAGPVGGKADFSGGKVAFVFSGNGAQWLGMGLKLLDGDAVFRATIEAIDALTRAKAGLSVIDELKATEAESRFREAPVIQPLIFAVQAAIADALIARGLVPDAVVGHSVGELAAAYVAGALTLEQAVEVIVRRSVVQERTRFMGRMAAAEIDEARARELIAPFDGRIELAAINAPGSVTLTGEEAALVELGAQLPGRRTSYNLLDFDYPFHSHHLDPYRDEVIGSLAGLAPSTGTAAFYSTVAGTPLDGDALDAAYWWDNMRSPVQFANAIAAMAGDGCALFVEISSHAIMQAYVRRNLRACDGHGRPLPTLRRDRDGPDALNVAADAAWEAGAQLDLEQLFPDPGPLVALPTYPWQREHCWIEPSPDASGQIYMRTEGAMLGSRLTGDLTLWQGQLDEALHPFLADHVIGGTVLLPATGFVELAVEAVVAARGDAPVVIEDLEIRQPMVLDPARRKLVRITLTDDGAIDIAGRARLTDEGWTPYAVARSSANAASPASITLPDLTDTPRTVWRADDHYAFAARLGLNYGPAFRTVRRVEVHADDIARVELSLPDELSDDAGRFALHPALFDGCLQGLFGLLRDTAGDGAPRAYLPTRIERLSVSRPGALPASCFIRLVQASETGLVADFVMRDEDDTIIAEARGFRFQRAHALGREAGGVYGFETVPLAPLAASHAGAAPQLPPVATDDSDLGPALDELAAGFAAAALGRIQLGGGDGGGGADATRLPLLEHCLALAVEAGALDPDDPASAVATGIDPLAHWRGFLAGRPDALAEATLIGRAGLHLTDILRGGDAAALLPSAATLELLHSCAPSAASSCEAICQAVLAAVGDAPPHRRLRIVELGGTLLAPRLMRALPRDRVTYAVAEFTDAPQALVDVALPVDPDIERRTIDPDHPLGPDNGWPEGSIDLIIGVQGLGTPPLDARNAPILRELLASDGALLLAAPRPASWLDLAFGAFAGWWRNNGDDARSRLRTSDEWREMLDAAGFEGAEITRAGGFHAMAARAPEQAAPVRTSDASVLLLCDAEATGGEAITDQLTMALRGHNASVSLARPEELEHEADWKRLWAARADAGDTPDQVVYLRGSDAAAMDADAMLRHAEASCGGAALLARTLAQASFDKTPALVLVTNQAGAPGQAPLRGLGRVIQNEYAELGTRLIELQDAGAAPETLAGPLADEILFGDDEDEVLLGPDRREGLRLREQAEPGPGVGAGSGATFRTLGFTPGNLESLDWIQAPATPLPSGAVEIAVRATGLNFRDVMYAMGMLSADIVEGGFAGATLGLEAAGDIVAVAPDVTGFSPGDRVFCFGPQCFAERVVVDTRAVSRIPAGLDYAAAATIATVFFTAHYALTRLAHLERGERILIHGAAGGVGLAAIQIARHLGAEVYATAGTPEKRDFVRLMGVKEANIFSSRDGDFDARLMDATDGEGVDLVLNSLFGEAIRKGLRCLRPFGRFVELGKRDFQLDTSVGLRPFRENISYFAVDADQLMAEKPALARDLLAELVTLFESGALQPLPRRIFARDEVVAAFRHMQHSQHIGKIVVAMPDEPPMVSPDVETGEQPFPVTADGCYLITGGAAGFGLATAGWLVERGARDVVLASRRGAIAEQDSKAFEAMTDAGARIDVVSCDVTDEAAVSALCGRLDAEGRPLRGVVHAAAVFDDAILATMTAEQLHRVLAPKIAGGWALHRATEQRALNFFILYSSVTTLFGNPGQGAYVAANAYLEALAEHRRSRGLCATAICWSAIADAGYLTRADDVRDAMEKRFGITTMSAARALEALPALVARGGSAATIIDFDPASLVRHLPAAGSARFRDVAGRRGAAGEAEREYDFERILAEASPEEVKQLLVELLTSETAKVLRLAPDRIDPRKSIFDLGMDSLMGLELMMGLEDALGIKLPAMSLGGDSSILILAERIYGLVAGKGVSDMNSVVEDSAVSDLLDRHDATVSDQDLTEIVGELDASESKQAV